MTPQTNLSLQPYQQILIMSRWYIVSRALHVIAELGIANYVDDEPIAIEELAKKTQTHASYLYRLLRFLTAYDIFKEAKPHYFIATPLSNAMRDDQEKSVRSTLCMVDEAWWNAAGNLEVSLKKGKAAFSATHGVNFFDYLSQDPTRQKRFDQGMADISKKDDESIALAYDFSQFASVVDVGGGTGGLITAIAKHYPNVYLVLMEQPQVIAQAIARMSATGVTNCECISGDFFADLPSDIDAYLYKGVLHDFNDKDVIKILRNTRRAMSSNSKLLIAEQVIPDSEGPHPNKTMDIVMMILLNGRQRNLAEWEELLAQSDLIIKNVIPTTSIFMVLECQVRN